MFISTVVHLFEFILLSLFGIMLYKLLASYKKWKSVSVSSSSKGGDRSGKLVKPALPQNPDYLSISKITVTEEESSSPSAKVKQSSVILTDYIGEFFAESKPMDLEPYRTAPSEMKVLKEMVTVSESSAIESSVIQTTERLPQTDATGVTQLATSSENRVTHGQVSTVSKDTVEDEIIQVKTLAFSPVIVKHAAVASNSGSLEQAELIPTLKEFADSDSYITVASGTCARDVNNIMSDKVVLAMLEEAKLVCAS